VTIGKDVRVAMRKYNDVPGNQIYITRAVLDLPSSSSCQDKVINDDVFGSLAKKRRYFTGGRRTKAPWRRELRVEVHRPFKLHRLEDFRESVHMTFDAGSRPSFRARAKNQHASTNDEDGFIPRF
jgi:hypothetical protein